MAGADARLEGAASPIREIDAPRARVRRGLEYAVIPHDVVTSGTRRRDRLSRHAEGSRHAMTLRRFWISLALGAVIGTTAFAQLSTERILNAQKEPQNWLTYSGGYMSQR